MSTVNDALVLNPYCPTCGQRTMLSENPEWLLVHFQRAPVFFRLLAHLIEARREGRGVPAKEIIEVLYNRRGHYRPKPNRRSASSDDRIYTQAIARFAPKLAKLGWAIVGNKTTGNGYYLVPIEHGR